MWSRHVEVGTLPRLMWTRDWRPIDLCLKIKMSKDLEDLELGRFDENESSVTMVGCESLEIFELLTSPKTIFKLITAIVIIFANTVLISIILRSTKFRRQRFHKFIVSLAFADLLIGVTIPFMTLTAKEHTWHLGPSLCQVRTITQGRGASL